jgi:hypothetical protein
VVLLVLLLERQFQLLRKEGLEPVCYAKACFENVWRRVPFLDSQTYMTFIGRRGVPVVQDGDVQVPVGYGPDALWSLKGPEDSPHATPKDRFVSVFTVARLLLAGSLGALGIPEEIVGSSMPEVIQSGFRTVVRD